MTAALDLSGQGFDVHLVEKEHELGGNLKQLRRTLKGEDTRVMLESLVEKVTSNPGISTYTEAKIKEISGYVGNFKTRFENSETEIEHGVVIVASGGQEHRPDEYFLGQDDRVITQRDLEEMMESRDKHELSSLKTVVMIQCVGSRDEKRPLCSRVCCSGAVKNAIRLKELNPWVSVYVLFRDIRTYGLKESFYRTAREKGVVFLRHDEDHKPVVTAKGSELEVRARDNILNRHIVISPDLVVLSTGIQPNPDNKALSQFLKVPLDADGFFLEAHLKLRPVDFATDGVYVCGLAHYPKDISETTVQARAAAGRAGTVLSRDTIESEGKISYIREERCSGCGSCVKVCAYSAVELDEEKRVAVVNTALCKGCGACSATCRSSAIDLKGFRNEQILEAIAAF